MCNVSVIKYQTVERESLLTSLDFRPKLLMTMVVSAIALMWESPVALAALTLALIATCLLVGVKISYVKTVFTAMVPFFVLLLITHGFWNTVRIRRLTGKEALTPLFTLPSHWWLIGGGGVSIEGFLYGWAVIFRTLTLVMALPLAIFTTEVNDVILGMTQAGVPYKLVFIFSSALRFFPLLFDQVQTIIEAQRLRGLALEKMGPLKRARVYARVAVPLILGAMVKSQQLEVVLQSKAFTGSGERTYLHESALRRTDHAVIALFILVLILAVALYFWQGVGRFGWLIYS